MKYIMIKICLGICLFILQNVAFANSAPLFSIPSHDSFFSNIAKHCRKAFEGTVSVDNQPSPAFDARLVMHIRKCTETELQIPFHVGDDASRT